MKKIITLIGAILITATFTAKADGMVFSMAEESYIADIPFDTYSIKSEMIFNNAMSAGFEMEEEEYINDIPFNTIEIVESTNSESEFRLAEEGYIDDIPFNTKKIVIEYFKVL
jgi:hypothetical protein